MKEIIKIDEFKKYNKLQKISALKRIALRTGYIRKKEMRSGGNIIPIYAEYYTNTK